MIDISSIGNVISFIYEGTLSIMSRLKFTNLVETKNKEQTIDMISSIISIVI